MRRTDGNGKFEDKTASFPFVKGNALAAVTTAIRSDTAARDVVVSYADRPGVLYRDLLNGQFTASDLNLLPAGARSLAAVDFNRDGLIDLVSSSVALRNNAGTFEWQTRLFLINFAPTSMAIGVKTISNCGQTVRCICLKTLRPISVGLLFASPERKILKTADDATIEMKSGAYYEKHIFHGTPLAFAIDGRSDVDAIRITWPNGLIQNEAHQKIAALTIPEAQRLSGSCPMIFTWDGEQYRFITDVLGVAPLGASSGDGNYFPVDHDEYFQIQGMRSKP